MSVGAAFGSFSHELVTKKSSSPNQEVPVPSAMPEPEHLDEQNVCEPDSSNSPTPPLPISDQLDQSDLPQLERIDSIMQRSVDDVAERLDKCLGKFLISDWLIEPNFLLASQSHELLFR